MLNYIGVFLTFKCRLGCEYCINRFGGLKARQELAPSEWMEVLKGVQTREDLPITLQGGEPTEYVGFYDLVMRLHQKGHRIDLLTNGAFDLDEFLANTTPEMFKRKAPYASIRFSFHKNTDEFCLTTKAHILQNRGYSVGIWGLGHPDMKKRNAKVAWQCREFGLDYREKEYLDEKHGTYKYPDAITGLKKIMVRCYPSEMLFAPNGEQYPCHHFLYRGDDSSALCLNDYVMCSHYGLCNPCDIKLKTNRLQESGHCSVRIEKV